MYGSPSFPDGDESIAALARSARIKSNGLVWFWYRWGTEVVVPIKLDVE